MNDQSSLREEVQEVYSAIARGSESEAPFPAGRDLALNLGYPAALLDSLPDTAVAAFCGVSDVSIWADIGEGVAVLDLGCGAGMDTLVAARRVGGRGRVIGVDFSPAMLARALQAVIEDGALNVELRRGDAEAIPLDNECVDRVLINGIFNLNPARDAIFREVARVVRPGGCVYASELTLNEPLSDEESVSATNWFA